MRHRELRSIKAQGSLWTSPRQPKWILLLGTPVSRDDIEHARLRRRGDHDDPRLHFALRCASVGCPALCEVAFVAARRDAQLEDQALRFMSDRSRNRCQPARGRLERRRSSTGLVKTFAWAIAEPTRCLRRAAGGAARCSAPELRLRRQVLVVSSHFAGLDRKTPQRTPHVEHAVTRPVPGCRPTSPRYECSVPGRSGALLAALALGQVPRTGPSPHHADGHELPFTSLPHC